MLRSIDLCAFVVSQMPNNDISEKQSCSEEKSVILVLTNVVTYMPKALKSEKQESSKRFSVCVCVSAITGIRIETDGNRGQVQWDRRRLRTSNKEISLTIPLSLCISADMWSVSASLRSTLLVDLFDLLVFTKSHLTFIEGASSM